MSSLHDPDDVHTFEVSVHMISLLYIQSTLSILSYIQELFAYFILKIFYFHKPNR